MALQDVRTPLRYGIVSSGLNIILDAVLIGPLGHGGLALATSVVAILNTVLLFRALHRRLRLTGGWAFLRSLTKSAFASASMAAVISLLIRYMRHAHFDHQLLHICICLFVGGAVYVAACQALRVEAVGDVWRTLRRGRRQESGDTPLR